MYQTAVNERNVYKIFDLVLDFHSRLRALGTICFVRMFVVIDFRVQLKSQQRQMYSQPDPLHRDK